MTARTLVGFLCCLGFPMTGCSRSQPQSGATPATAPSIAAKSAATASVSSAAPAPAASAAPSPSAAAPTGVARPLNAQRLCVGDGHTCFVDAKHSLWCWGGNTYGQVGNGTHGFGGKTENTDMEHAVVKRPTRIRELEGKASAVGCGSQRSCALTLDGKILCFGNNENPKRTERFTDVPLPRPIGGKATQLALKADHACAVREDHTLWCWGSNYNGQLGAGPPTPGTADEYTPATQVQAFGNDVVNVTVFEEGTCVIKQGGSLWCLGENREGELGDGSYDKRLAPVRPSGLTNVVAVAGGKRHVCAVSADGRLSCWGRNYEGQLGNGQTPATKPVNYASPLLVPEQFNGIRALDLGYAETLVVDAAGDLRAFGDLSKSVRGIPPKPQSTARKIALPAPVVEVRANTTHRCALLANESVWCWGEGEFYALGTGHSDGKADPAMVRFPN